jgi:hypothetical protein
MFVSLADALCRGQCSVCIRFVMSSEGSVRDSYSLAGLLLRPWVDPHLSIRIRLVLPVDKQKRRKSSASTDRHMANRDGLTIDIDKDSG